MKKILGLLLVLLWAPLAFGQISGGASKVIVVGAQPSSCSAGYIYVDVVNTVMYFGNNSGTCTSTGGGGGSGANTSLSNLHNPTAINLTTLTFAGAAGLTAGGSAQNVILTPSTGGSIQALGGAMNLLDPTAATLVELSEDIFSGVANTALEGDQMGVGNTNSQFFLQNTLNNVNLLTLGNGAGNLDWIGTEYLTLDDGSGNQTIGYDTAQAGVASSPYTRWAGTYEATSGPTYGLDYWSLKDVVGAGVNGTSTLTFGHTGSTGALSWSVPSGTTAPSLNAGTATQLQGGPISVLGEGAKCDGSTDDHVAIQAAISAANTAGGGGVSIPAGTCSIGSTGITLAQGVYIEGQGPAASTLKYTGSGVGVTGSGPMSSGGMGNLTILMPANGTSTGLLLSPGSGGEIYNLSFPNLIITTSAVITTGQIGVNVVQESGGAGNQVTFTSFDSLTINYFDQPIKNTGNEKLSFPNLDINFFGSGTTAYAIQDNNAHNYYQGVISTPQYATTNYGIYGAAYEDTVILRCDIHNGTCNGLTGVGNIVDTAILYEGVTARGSLGDAINTPQPPVVNYAGLYSVAYSSGGSVTGAIGTTCLATFGASPANGVAQVTLTALNSFAGSTIVPVVSSITGGYTWGGEGFTSPPTTSVALASGGSNPATSCSGTLTVTSKLTVLDPSYNLSLTSGTALGGTPSIPSIYPSAFVECPASACTEQLPVAAPVGTQRCYSQVPGNNGVITVAATSGVTIWRQGIAGTTSTGTLVSSGTVSDFACLWVDNSNRWVEQGESKNAWTNN